MRSSSDGPDTGEGYAIAGTVPNARGGYPHTGGAALGRPPGSPPAAAARAGVVAPATRPPAGVVALRRGRSSERERGEQHGHACLILWYNSDITVQVLVLRSPPCRITIAAIAPPDPALT